MPSPRDVPSYDHKPEMSAAERRGRGSCAAIEPAGYAFAVVNFANPDMVGHTGVDSRRRARGGDGRRLPRPRPRGRRARRRGRARDRRPRQRRDDARAGRRQPAHRAHDEPGARRPHRARRDARERRARGRRADDPRPARARGAGADERQKSSRTRPEIGLYCATLSLPQPDSGVLRKAQRGDDRAFSIIVRAYQVPVFNYVLAHGRRALAGRGSDAGGLPPRLPGAAALSTPARSSRPGSSR